MYNIHSSIIKRRCFKINYDFGKYLRELRKSRKLSLVDTAEMAGLSHSYLSQIERAERGVKGIPSPDVLRKLASPLGVSYLELMKVAGYITEEEIINAFIDSDFSIDDDSVLSQVIENRSEKLRELTTLLDGVNAAYLNGHLLSSEDCKRIINVLYELFPEYSTK